MLTTIFLKRTVESKLLSSERLDFEDFGATIWTGAFFKLGPGDTFKAKYLVTGTMTLNKISRYVVANSTLQLF
jgi:hypothetical protein